MDLSISALTANRLLGKAVIRVSPQLKRLKELVAGVPEPDASFDILQVVLSDEPPKTVRRLTQKRGSRLLQVKVGLPSELTFRPDTDKALLDAIGERVVEATKASGAGDEVITEVRARVDNWNRERSGQGADD